jgi:membrane fusion protein, multidrug efflux system
MTDGEQIQKNLAASLCKEKPSETPPGPNTKRNRIVGYLLLFFGLLGIIAFILWWELFRNHVATDDAYVNGNMVVVSSRQDGTAIAFYADDTDFVKQGQLLVELDPTDYVLYFEQTKTALELAARQVRSLYEEVREREADVLYRMALHGRNLTDYNNRNALVGAQAVSKEDYTHSQADLDAAQASLDLAIHQLAGAKARLGSGPLPNHPSIEQAKYNVREAYLGVKRCSIFAPVSGFVAKRTVQAGTSIKATTPLLAVIPLDYIWIDANFKETQLTYIRIGQPVEVTADIYGRHVVYEGRVGGIQGGSGAVFSLLPPQNATGNWIKIVQRVPVRIYLNPQQIQEHPLLLGLSVYARVDISNTDGLFLAQQVPEEALMTTDVFDVPFDSLDALLDTLVEKNLNMNIESSPSETMAISFKRSHSRDSGESM